MSMPEPSASVLIAPQPTMKAMGTPGWMSGAGSSSSRRMSAHVVGGVSVGIASFITCVPASKALSRQSRNSS